MPLEGVEWGDAGVEGERGVVWEALDGAGLGEDLLLGRGQLDALVVAGHGDAAGAMTVGAFPAASLFVSNCVPITALPVALTDRTRRLMRAALGQRPAVGDRREVEGGVGEGGGVEVDCLAALIPSLD